MAKVIEIIGGYVVVVSNCDYRKLSKRKWQIYRSGGKGRKLGEPYAGTMINKKKVYLHRLIMGSPVGYVVDHINNQTLDCRRENLRVVSFKENMANRIDRKKKIRTK